jgi:Domain of unknown function (DUF4062)
MMTSTAVADSAPVAAAAFPVQDAGAARRAAEVIRTPDQRLRVFVSSTPQELAPERQAVRDAVTGLRLNPVMFELGARPHPARQVYRAYLAQSQVFVGVYWQSYGWVGPGEEISGLEDEYRLSAGLPRLIYVKSPAPQREPRLTEMLARIRDDGTISYQRFSDAAELRRLVEEDLALLLSERFEMTLPRAGASADAPLAGALPVPSTPLEGRDHDVATVQSLVLEEGARLVTLTGPGGVGKSRLTTEIADRLAPSFADGVRFVDLAVVKDAGLVIDAVAAGLGVSTPGRLRGGANWQQAHDRHAAYFLALAEPAEAERQDPGQLAWLDRLETAHDNLRAALSWLTEQDQIEPILILSWGTWRYWWLRGHADELARYGENLLVKSERLPPRQRALALSMMGFTLIATGDYAKAQTVLAQGDLAGAAGHLNEGLALAAEARDLSSVAYYLEELAAVARQQDIPARAVRLLAAARSLLQAGGSGWLCAWVPRAPHDDDVLTDLRSRVGDTAFEQAWSWAESVDGPRAVEFALEKDNPADPEAA